jgi:hypothetical protein
MADANDITHTGQADAGTDGGGDARRARLATGEELAALLHSDASEVLLALLENSALQEPEICVLLRRNSLPATVVKEICKRREWVKSYPVKKCLAFHPHTPRLVGLRLLRELYLMDLVQMALLPGVSAELKRNAEGQLAARLPQLPLGQKITLGRRGPARVAGLLLGEGHPLVVTVALDNADLTASQILKVLAREAVPESVVQAIAQHRKWSCDYNVRLALVRNPGSTLSTVLGYLPTITVADLSALAEPGIVPERLRKYLEAEVQRRIRLGEKSAGEEKSFEDRHQAKDT